MPLRRRIFHAWWLKRRVLAQGCAFWDFFTLLQFRGSKTLQKQFCGMNRRFQAKLSKSKNVHIIKTTALIPTKFCTVIKTTKCPSWMIPIPALQTQDGGWPPSWKNRNIVISRPKFKRFWRNLVVFITVQCHSWSGPDTRITTAILEKLKNSHISAAVWPILTKFGKLVQFVPLDRSDR